MRDKGGSKGFASILYRSYKWLPQDSLHPNSEVALGRTASSHAFCSRTSNRMALHKCSTSKPEASNPPRKALTEGISSVAKPINCNHEGWPGSLSGCLCSARRL